MRPTRRYRLLSAALVPPLLAHALWRGARDGGARYVRQRLGFGPGRASGEPPCRWVHAASVGEVVTVLPLLEAMLATDGRTASGPGHPSGTPDVLVTTNTPTGAAVLARRAPAGVRHRYLPIDRPGPTRRFLARERPRSGWIVETEIWPWLYARCHEAGTPLTIVNARLSPRTARHAEGPFAGTYRRALHGVDVLARSATDAAAYRELGAEPSRVRAMGDLKLAGSAPTASVTPPIDHPYVLAASTHEDEEERIARAWLTLPDSVLLVLAPRHPERGAAIARRLGRLAGITPRRRSLGEAPEAAARLYLADTVGELDAWYAHARGAFVGGSLVERGGHNVLEPARHGLAIVVGPHTANFADAMAALREADAIVEVDDAAAAAATLHRAGRGEADLAARGARAAAVAAGGGGLIDDYLEALGARTG